MQTKHIGADELEVQRRQAAGNPRKKTGRDEGRVADHPRVKAQVSNARRVITARVQQQTQWRSREGDQQPRTPQEVHRNQAIELYLWSQREGAYGLCHEPINTDACFSAKDLGHHERGRPHQLTQPQGDHGEGSRCAPRAKPTQQRG